MMTETTITDLRLGLIGDNIAASKTPMLHRHVGRHRGLVYVYDSLIPPKLGKSFDEIFADCAAGEYRGLNITYPYKEKVVKKLTIDDPLVCAIGAVNTVLFEAEGPKGFNTDYSGFMAAYRNVIGDAAPGAVCMIGAGGVGRAVAFGLLALGAVSIRIADRDLTKAETLASDLRAASPALEVITTGEVLEAAKGATGLINCTPVGMVGYEGTPLPRAAMCGAKWAFDAVYTPVETEFLKDAEAEGLAIISGYELFVYQGIHASKLFTGEAPDEARLRADLLKGE